MFTTVAMHAFAAYCVPGGIVVLQCSGCDGSMYLKIHGLVSCKFKLGRHQVLLEVCLVLQGVAAAASSSNRLHSN